MQETPVLALPAPRRAYINELQFAGVILGGVVGIAATFALAGILALAAVVAALAAALALAIILGFTIVLALGVIVEQLGLEAGLVQDRGAGHRAALGRHGLIRGGRGKRGSRRTAGGSDDQSTQRSSGDHNVGLGLHSTILLNGWPIEASVANGVHLIPRAATVIVHVYADQAESGFPKLADRPNFWRLKRFERLQQRSTPHARQVSTPAIPFIPKLRAFYDAEYEP